MKTKGLFIALCLLIAMGANAKEIKGNGNLVTKEIKVAPFESIRIDLEGRKRFKWQFFGKEEDVKKPSKGCFFYSQTPGETALSVTIDENLFPYLDITSSGGELTVNGKKDIKLIPTKLEIAASSYNLKALRLNGCMDFEVVTPLTTSDLAVYLGGVGGVKMLYLVRTGSFSALLSGVGSMNISDLVCDKAIVTVSGVGHCSLAGEADYADFSVSGVGSIHAYDFKAKNMEIEASGVGSVNVHATESLDAKHSGVSSIKYKGNPAYTKINSSGLGSIKMVD